MVGAPARPGAQRRTVRELEVEVENMGGQLNAYTGREQTAYYAKVLGKDVGKAINILSDILLNSNLDERAINKERSVILREMEEVRAPCCWQRCATSAGRGGPRRHGKRISALFCARVPQVNKQTSELVFDHLHATAFQYSPLGRTILGPVENIKSLKRSQLAAYMKTHYRGPRMVRARACGAGASNRRGQCGALLLAVWPGWDTCCQGESRQMRRRFPQLWKRE